MKTNQKIKTDLSFKRALNRSFALHAIFLLIIIIRFAFPNFSSQPMAMTAQVMEDNPTPIQASMIDSRELDAAAARKEKEKADALAKAELEKQQKIAEENRLKAEQEKLELARKAEEKRLAEVQAQKKAAELALQKKKEVEAVQKLAAQKALKAAEEATKAKKMAEEKAAKAKKESELAKAMAAERMPVADASALSKESLRELDRYKLLVQQQIMRNWFIQGSPAPGLSTLLFVRVAADGSVLDVKIKRSSGNDALDRSAMAAVIKASPLPVPQDPSMSVHFRELNLTLRPDDVVQGA